MASVLQLPDVSECIALTAGKATAASLAGTCRPVRHAVGLTACFPEWGLPLQDASDERMLSKLFVTQLEAMLQGTGGSSSSRRRMTTPRMESAESPDKDCSFQFVQLTREGSLLPPVCPLEYEFGVFFADLMPRRRLTQGYYSPPQERPALQAIWQSIVHALSAHTEASSYSEALVSCRQQGWLHASRFEEDSQVYVTSLLSILRLSEDAYAVAVADADFLEARINVCTPLSGSYLARLLEKRQPRLCCLQALTDWFRLAMFGSEEAGQAAPEGSVAEHWRAVYLTPEDWAKWAKNGDDWADELHRRRPRARAFRPGICRCS
eukprot:TRINITY_DN63638_c0_g1_i1.p1 TRINITY_DN63638_c0_g1~~TRINITY_DN63638_c0_g1_i1.p1  ORF type:complete len:322 (+),score=49.34 TRINITY_DN63638_c0_g1_i1:57-1022(+)